MQQTPCTRSKQLTSGPVRLSVVVTVAVVAVDLAANLAAWPPRTVNIDVSSAGTNRGNQFVKFSSADSFLIGEVRNIRCRDGA